jgi:hypothetical protein
MPGLFDRINAVYEKRHDSGLNAEQTRLVERFHLDFVRAGKHQQIVCSFYGGPRAFSAVHRAYHTN